jgi:amino acid transporter
MNKILVISLAALVAIVFLVLAGVYWTHPADQLPHWLPGYSATDSAVHIKHGLGAVIIAIGAGILAWFQSGPKPAEQTPSADK